MTQPTRQSFAWAHFPSPPKSIAWIAPPCTIRTTRAGSPGGLNGAGTTAGAPACGLLEHLAQRLPAGPRDEGCDRDRPQSMDRTIEEDDEEKDPEPEERPRYGHAEFGTSFLRPGA